MSVSQVRQGVSMTHGPGCQHDGWGRVSVYHVGQGWAGRQYDEWGRVSVCHVGQGGAGCQYEE